MSGMLVQVRLLWVRSLLAFPMRSPRGAQTAAPLRTPLPTLGHSYTLVTVVRVISQVGLKTFRQVNSAVPQKSVGLAVEDLSVYYLTNLDGHGQQFALKLRVHVFVSHVS